MKHGLRWIVSLAEQQPVVMASCTAGCLEKRAANEVGDQVVAVAAVNSVLVVVVVVVENQAAVAAAEAAADPMVAEGAKGAEACPPSLVRHTHCRRLDGPTKRS